MKQRILLSLLAFTLLTNQINAADANENSNNGRFSALNCATWLLNGTKRVVSGAIDLSLLGIGTGSLAAGTAFYTCGRDMEKQPLLKMIFDSGNLPRPSLEDQIAMKVYGIGFAAVGTVALGTLALKKCYWERETVRG